MKKRDMKFTIGLTALLLLQSMFVFGQSTVNLRLYKPGTEIAVLHIDSLMKEEPVTVTVKDEQGVILFTDKSNASEYMKLIDFSKINSGKYYIDVANPAKVIRKVVSKETGGLSIDTGSNYLYIYNNLGKLQEDNRKLLVKFNNKLDEAVTLRITDSEGNVLHEEAGIKSANYATLFNLSKLTSGVYNMSVSSGSFTNSRTFKLD